MAAVPEDLRCKRSDGKQWRCSAPSMPDKTVCEKHYVQAKRRSASSALRASLRRSSSSSATAAARLRDEGRPAPLPMAVARPLYARVAGEAVYVAEPVPTPAPAPARGEVAYEGLPLGNAAGARTAAVSSAAASCCVTRSQSRLLC
jgi:lysine-specific demethylase 3